MKTLYSEPSDGGDAAHRELQLECCHPPQVPCWVGLVLMGTGLVCIGIMVWLAL
jgi:hypothetical protein